MEAALSVGKALVGGKSLREQLEGVKLSLSAPEEQQAGKEKDREET